MKAQFTYFAFSPKTRFCGAFFFYALAALSRFPPARTPAVPALTFLGGLVLLCLPLWLLAAGNFPPPPPGTRDAEDPRGEDWQSLSVKEVDRLAGRLRRAKQLRIPLWYDIQLGIIITPLAGFALCVMGGLAGAEGAFLLTALYLVFFPSLWFARIKKRYPRDLAEKLHAFTPVLNNPAETPEKKDSPWNGYKVTPMILFDRDNEGGKTPRDIRVMLEPPKNKTPELAGVQFQITFNRGPRGKVPYMYAVFITRGKGQLWQRLGDLEYPGYTVEKESSPEQEEYGAVVLRLHTTSRRDGYHTREEDIKTLISRVKETLEKIETPWGSKRSL